MITPTTTLHPFDRGEANSQTREQAIVDLGNYIFVGNLPHDLPSLIDA